jgi:hydrogenase-4 component B
VTHVLTATYLVVAVSVVAAFAAPRAGAALATAGCALMAAVGIATAGAWAAPVSVGLGGWLGFGPAALLSDRLAGIFLALLGVAGGAVSLALVERPPQRLVTALHCLLLLALATVIGADQGFVFLLAWEVVTLTLYLLAASDRERPGSLFAAYFGGTMNKLGGGALLAAFGLMYAATGSFRFEDWAHAGAALSGGMRSAVFVLLLVGFGTKVGLVPFQGPLPPAYAATPGAVAATASIALNAGFYGLWRLVFEVLAPRSLWEGELVMTLGAAGALVGILYAIGQARLKRFLGFSSVEHAGIVLIGFGVALIGEATGVPKLAAAGLLAATLQLLMHGVAKTLAFLGADRVAATSGTESLAPFGGLGARLPRTGAGFGIAVLSLAAIPPFGGFVSEWFTLEALLQAFRLGDTLVRLLMALSAALLALTAGLALLAFAKLYGTVFLGRARSALAGVREPGAGVGFGLLTALVLALGALAPWEIRWLGTGLSDLVGFDLSRSTISSPLVLGPVFPNFSVLAPTWLAVAIPGFVVASALLVRALLRPPVRRAPIWLSGTQVAPALVQYTPAAYSNPIRVVLRGAYGFAREVVPAGAGTRGAPGRLVLRTRIVPAFEAYLYLPLARLALGATALVRRLQSGRLSLYLLYLLVVLIAVLAAIPALGR